MQRKAFSNCFYLFFMSLKSKIKLYLTEISYAYQWIKKPKKELRYQETLWSVFMHFCFHTLLFSCTFVFIHFCFHSLLFSFTFVFIHFCFHTLLFWYTFVFIHFFAKRKPTSFIIEPCTKLHTTYKKYTNNHSLTVSNC